MTLAQEVMEFNETTMQVDMADHWWDFEMSQGFLDRIFDLDFGPSIELVEYLGYEAAVPPAFAEEARERRERMRQALDADEIPAPPLSRN